MLLFSTSQKAFATEQTFVSIFMIFLSASFSQG
jgi:hypothetical protein